MPQSWKVEVTTTGDKGTWVANRLRFPDKEQAEVYGRGLFFRWTAVEEWRAVEDDEPVNYIDGQFVEPKGDTLP